MFCQGEVHLLRDESYFFIETDDSGGEEVRFSTEESNHLVKSLRVLVGDEVIASDGHGSIHRIRILSKKDGVRGSVVSTEHVEREPCEIELAVGLGPNDCMKWVVEKATELGVERIVFLVTSLSRQPGNSRQQSALLERLRRITVSAMKQSKRAYLPSIDAPVGYENFLSSCTDRRVRFVLDEKIDKPTLVEALKSEEGRGYTVLVGPQSGLEEHEKILAAQAGFVPASLGPARLRVETAALMSISVIKCLASSI